MDDKMCILSYFSGSPVKARKSIPWKVQHWTEENKKTNLIYRIVVERWPVAL